MPSIQELDLKHLWQTFKSFLRFSYRFRCELWLSDSKMLHIHFQMALIYSLSGMITVTSLTRFYSISLWISGRNFLLVYDETPCSCTPCRSATHIIMGQKRHFSRQTNSIHTCNLSLSLFLTYEATSGSHQLHTHNLLHLHMTLLLILLNVSPSLPLDRALCCNVHSFCTPSCQSDHQPFGLKVISLRWDHSYSDSRGWSQNPFNHNVCA